LWHAIRTHIHVHYTNISDFILFAIFSKKIVGEHISWGAEKPCPLGMRSIKKDAR
jgi:hypothetical protein